MGTRAGTPSRHPPADRGAQLSPLRTGLAISRHPLGYPLGWSRRPCRLAERLAPCTGSPTSPAEPVAGPSPPLGTVAAVARSDPARVHAARVTGAATAVRDVIVSDAGSDRQRRHRAEWPELWEHLDALADVVAPPERPTL